MFWGLLGVSLRGVHGWGQSFPDGWCGQEMYTQQLLERQPDVVSEVLHSLPVVTEDETSEGLRVIPVVVHILHEGGTENISDAQVQAAIEQLNKDFRGSNADTAGVRSIFKSLIADMEFEFRLAGRDPQGNCTNGIIRHFTDATNEGGDTRIKAFRWPTNKYLNIYVVKRIKNSGSGTILGYAYLPHMAANQSHDGVVIVASEMNAFSRTLTHEVGHYLGLLHTFQNGCNGANDNVGDTPPTQGSNFDCNASQNTCHNDNPDMPDMIENHMDYSSCPRMFTVGQKSRVNSQFNFYRSGLSTPSNLQATGVGTSYTCAAVPDFWVEPPHVRVGMDVQLMNRSNYQGTVSFGWDLPGASPSSSTAESPTVSYATEGVYDVSLTITQGNVSKTKTHSRAVTVLPAIPWITRPWLEPVTPQQMPEWMFPQNEYGHRWEVTTQASFSPPASIFYDNYTNGRKGEEVHLFLPPVDMTALDIPVLKFKYAYAQRDASDKDLLAVYVSTNDGTTWIPKWFRRSNQMLTVGGLHPSAFYPQGRNGWDSVQINLTSVASHSNLLIRFSFRSGRQNNIFLDDIQLGNNVVWSGIRDVPYRIDGVRITSKEIVVEGDRTPPLIEVFHVNGQLRARTRARQLDISKYPRGSYWVRVIDSEGKAFVYPFIRP